MFTYIDPRVRETLVQDGKLVRITRRGNICDSEDAPEGTLSVLGPIPLPLEKDAEQFNAEWYASMRHTELCRTNELADRLRENDGQQAFALLADSVAVNSVLLFGDPASWKNPLVRVHSNCLTGDVFGSCRCECGPQFVQALKRVSADSEGGMIIYMSGHEGRGIGLWAKAATYLLQDAGEDTYEANRSLGLPDDSRDFSDAAALLHYFIGNQPFRLMTNNPKKVQDLNSMGLTKFTRESHVCGVGDVNRRYLKAKQAKGHRFESEDLE